MDELSLRRQMAATAQKMYARGLITGLAGNISARLAPGRLLVTPGGICKEDLQPEQMLVVDLEGRLLASPAGFGPTSELPMHLEVYRQRPEAGAVVHAHPTACVALSLVGLSLETPYIPEAVVLLGPVPTAPYATPSSDENRLAIQDLIASHQAIILAHHGALTLGVDLAEAWLRMETLEHVAQAVVLAHQLGTPTPLTPQAVAKLRR